MTGENVEYVVSLKDLMSGKLDAIDSKTKGLNASMSSLMGVAAGAFAVIGGTEFLKSSVDAYNESSKAGAQLQATLESTGYAAGLTREALDKQAESLMKVSTFDDDAITGAQSLLLTFTNIRGEIAEKTTPAILDLATKMGGDLQGATIQIGKALNDPIKGITALTKVGVSFSESQKDTIKSLVETGHTAQAQQMILSELNTEFGGSAAAAAGTYQGQLQILKNEFGNIKEEIGGMVMALVIKLKPAMQWTIDAFQTSVTWIKEHTTEIEALSVAVGVVAGAWMLYQIPLVVASAATTVMTAAQWALNIALNANPIGIVVVALAALAGGIYYAYQKSETFRGGVMGVWEVLKGLFNFITSAGGGVMKYLEGIFTLDIDKMKEGALQVAKAWKEMDLSADFEKGKTIGINAVKDESKTKVASPIKGKASVLDSGATTGKKLKSASDVTGQKVYTINIKIDSLIKDFKVSTTTINESATKVKEMVTQALLSAVNDSQIIAE